MSTTGVGDGQLRSLTTPRPVLVYLREVWGRRALAIAIARGNLQSMHLDTVLGNAWHLLNPVLMVSVYYLVFGRLIRLDRGVENFIAFLTIGVFTFQFINRAVTASSRSIPQNIGLIRSLHFPRAVLPLSSILQEVTAFGFSSLAVLIVLLVTREGPRVEWLLVPFVFVGIVAFATGAGLIVARLGDLVNDVSNVLPFLFRLTFYVSGVLFSVERFVSSERLRTAMVANPFYSSIELLRHLLMRTYTTEFPVRMAVSIGVWGVALLVIGMLVFRRGEPEFGRA